MGIETILNAIATQQAIERQAEAKLVMRKQKACDFVHEQADLAVKRLNAINWLWSTPYKRKVCPYIGPHPTWLCVDHALRIRLIEIPGANQGEYRFYLGKDGWIYRAGDDKIYRVDLMARNWPSEIRGLGQKIKDAWCD